MPANWAKRIVGILVLGLIAAGLAWFAWPRPLPVDLATVSKGPIEVTADDDGKTHVRHIYTESAPVAGKFCAFRIRWESRGLRFTSATRLLRMKLSSR